MMTAAGPPMGSTIWATWTTSNPGENNRCGC